MALPPENIRVSGSEYPVSRWGRVRCTAMSKQTGRRCGAYAVDGGTTCKYHGGKHTPKALLEFPGMPGRYDAVIKNEKLREKYQRLAKDQELTDQQDDLALLRAMCEVIVERAFKDADEDLHKMSTDKIAAVTGMLQQVDKLVASISEREAKQKLTVKVDVVAVVIDRVVEVVQRYVSDPGVLRQLANELSSIQVA